MLNNIFNSQTKTVTFAAILLSISGLISRVLGLFRDRLLAGRFGASEELDIYFSAFRIPDFVYGVLIVGGITAAFLPVFSEYFKKEKKDCQWPREATELVNNVLNCFLFLLILICLILAIFTPSIVKIIIPGFSPENKNLTIALTRIMFLSPIFLGISSVFSGILHYFNRFLAYSLAPVLYNLGIIFGILFLVPLFGIFGLAYGVILGAFFHLIIQFPAARISGFRYKAVFNFKSPGLKKIFKLMLPRTIGTAAYHINLIVITAIASTLTVGSIAIFNFSNNLQYLPVGLIGVSFALSSFPFLSRAWAKGRKEEFLKSFSSSFRQILFLIIPISLLMFLLRAQIVRLVLGTGRFGWWETRLTAASLGIFCLGIFAGSLIPLISRAFFALQDTKTPVIIGTISMIGNIVFAFLFTWLLRFSNFFRNLFAFLLKLKNPVNGVRIVENIEVIGLPLALSLALIIQLFLLLIFLYKKLGDLKISEVFSSIKKILIAGVIMIIVAYFVRQFVVNFVNMHTFFGIFVQTLLTALAGFSVYFLIAFLTRSSEIKTIKSAILKQFGRSEYNESEAN